MGDLGRDGLNGGWGVGGGVKGSQTKRRDENRELKNAAVSPPLWKGGEVGEDVACHHVQARLGQFQVHRLQTLVGLRHRVLVGGAQAAGGGGGVHPAPARRPQGES